MPIKKDGKAMTETTKITELRFVTEQDVIDWAEAAKSKDASKWATADTQYVRPSNVGEIGELLILDADAHVKFAALKNVRKRSVEQRVAIAQFYATMEAQTSLRNLSKMFPEMITLETVNEMVGKLRAAAAESVHADDFSAWLQENTKANRDKLMTLVRNWVIAGDKLLKVDKDKQNRRHYEIVTTDANNVPVLVTFTVTEVAK